MARTDKTAVISTRLANAEKYCQSTFPHPKSTFPISSYAVLRSIRKIANAYCRTRCMSAWAAEIDALCEAYDVLVVQSAGNLPIFGANPYPGIRDHLAAGRDYPAFLCEDSTRITNPAQSLQALTVGSIAYGALESGPWRTFAAETGQPSAFSRSGLGIWTVIKPDVVEYGGDAIRTANAPPDVQ